MANVDITIRTIDQTGGGIRGFESKLKGMLSTIGLVTAGATVMGGVFKKAFDFAEQGAQLEFIEQKFGRLAASIGSDSQSILDALTEVSRGTLTTAQMMDQASQIISLGLADNQEDVVKLASLVTNLGWDMQQVILTFANDSKMRLDALGLSVEDVTRRAQEFEDAGESATRAFDLAVLAAGEEKLKLVGSAADSDVGAFLRLKVVVGELTDEFKRQMNEGLNPWVKLLVDDYGTAVTAAVENNLAMVDSLEDVEAQMRRLTDARGIWLGMGDEITGTEDELKQAFVETARALAVQSGSWEAFSQAVSKNTDVAGRRLLLVDGTIKGFYEEAIALENLRIRNDLARQTMERHAAAQEAFADTLSEHTTPEYRRLMDIVEVSRIPMLQWTAAARAAEQVAMDKANALSNHTAPGYAAVMEAVRNSRVNMEDWIATGERTAETALAVGAALQGGLSGQLNNIDGLFDAYGDLADAQGEWLQGTRDNNDEIAELHTQLMGDLDEETRKGYAEILAAAEEGSAEWVAMYDAIQGDLTQSQRDALIRQIADLQAHHGEVVGIYTGDAEAAEEAQARIDEALGKIALGYSETVLEMMTARAGGVFTQDAADFAVAAGIMSQAEADYRLQLQQHYSVDLPKLEEAQLKRILTERELAIATELLATGQARSAESAIIQASASGQLAAKLGEAYTQTVNLKGALLETAGDYDVNINVNIPDIPQPWWAQGAGGSAPVGPGSSGPQTPQHSAAGGLVTGGIPGQDSVPALLRPFERVLSVSENRAYEQGMNGGGGSITINNNFNYPPPNPAAWAEQAAVELGNRMRG